MDPNVYAEMVDVLTQLRDEWFEPHYGHNNIGMAALLRDKIRGVLRKHDAVIVDLAAHDSGDPACPPDCYCHDLKRFR